MLRHASLRERRRASALPGAQRQRRSGTAQEHRASLPGRGFVDFPQGFRRDSDTRVQPQ